MTEPVVTPNPRATGNRWWDPDTVHDENGKRRPRSEWRLANPGNYIPQEDTGANINKLGPGVVDPDVYFKDDPAGLEDFYGRFPDRRPEAGAIELPVPEDRPQVVQEVAELHTPPEVEVPITSQQEDARDELEVRQGIVAAAKDDREKRPEGRAALEAFALEEYTRPEGVRPRIRMLLTRYGVKNPRGV